MILGNTQVIAVAMNVIDGLMRGIGVIDTGTHVSILVGGATLGQILTSLAILFII